jgi:hypothetical protein
MVATAIATTAMLAALVACVHSMYDPPTIVLTFSPGFQPPAALNTGANAGIAVTATNGPLNGNDVGFSCSPVGACGTFTPGSAPSTIPVCYLAPNSVPPDGTVTVTATSAVDSTKFISATITIENGPGQPCP